MPTPSFNREPGTPDLQAGTWWIEAKTVNKSAEARAYDEAVIRPDLEVGKIVMTPATTPLVPPSRGLIGKFQHDLDDAVAKRDRQGRPGQLVVFYDWVNADFGVSRRKAHIEVIEWAQQAELSSCVKIVIAWELQLASADISEPLGRDW